MIDKATLKALTQNLDAERERLLARDHANFVRSLQRAQRGGKLDLARLNRDVEQARLRYENRLRLKPERIRYPEELPVVQASAELLTAIREHPVIVSSAERRVGEECVSTCRTGW